MKAPAGDSGGQTILERLEQPVRGRRRPADDTGDGFACARGSVSRSRDKLGSRARAGQVRHRADDISRPDLGDHTGYGAFRRGGEIGDNSCRGVEPRDLDASLLR